GTFTVEGDPVPQPRPRVYRNGGVGEDPRATRHKQATVMAARRARVPLIAGDVELQATYLRANARRCDWDNLAKLTCDALTGIAWSDDSQIVSVQVLKGVDRLRPRTEVTVRVWRPPPADWHDAWEGTP
ncbi:MAG: RusA family crossover junction endodeoxyribonuclease, partial [Betaproteobacteria bacterium]|nr:RusA family crossover junction endodeoxyribonuclease [Betaproteobacteria bacterium]